MAGRPAWNTVLWIAFILGNSCVLGPATVAVISALRGEEVSDRLGLTCLVGSAVNLFAALIYYVFLLAAGDSGFASVTYFFDPTNPSADVTSAVTSVSAIAGARMPRLSFDRDWCDWCEQENGGVPLCVQACGSLALELAPQAARESTVMGIAEIDASQCLAHRQMNCRRCYDACPYGAMELDAAGRPVVVEELCTGCGACEAACVSLANASVGTEIERRAITVQPAELGIGGRS